MISNDNTDRDPDLDADPENSLNKAMV